MKKKVIHAFDSSNPCLLLLTLAWHYFPESGARIFFLFSFIPRFWAQFVKNPGCMPSQSRSFVAAAARLAVVLHCLFLFSASFGPFSFPMQLGRSRNYSSASAAMEREMFLQNVKIFNLVDVVVVRVHLSNSSRSCEQIPCLHPS